MRKENELHLRYKIVVTDLDPIGLGIWGPLMLILLPMVSLFYV